MPSPDDRLLDALRRLGERGQRAADFLVTAGEQLGHRGTRAGELTAYALRETLMSLVALGGERKRGVREAAEDVVRRSRAVREGGADVSTLSASIARLDAALTGPGPNERRLEIAITQVARRRPTRSSADLLEQFSVLLDAVSTALHSTITRDEAARLYERTLGVTQSLFGPLTERLAEVDALLAIENPEDTDVKRLRGYVGDERHLAYFFERAEGPGWFRVLRGEPVLEPPPSELWTAGPYVARVAETHPDELRTWLSERKGTALNSKQAADLLHIARILSIGVAGSVLTLAKPHLADMRVRFSVDAYLRELPPEERGEGAIVWLVRLALDEVLKGDRASSDTYLAAELLNVGLLAMRAGDAARWLSILVHRLRFVAAREPPLRLRVLAPLSELRVDAGATPIALATAAVVQASSIAAEQGVPLSDRIKTLEQLPSPLHVRVIAQQLAAEPPNGADIARSFALRQIAGNSDPTPEELVLVRQLGSGPATGLAAELLSALGMPPCPADLVAASGRDNVSDDLRRAHRWLVAMPEEVRATWAEADEALTDDLGAAPEDGVLMRSGVASWVGNSSPYGPQSLSGLSPFKAAAKIASWRRPADSSFMDASARGLAEALEQVVEQNPNAWLAAGLDGVVIELCHPLYIAACLSALGKDPAELAGHVDSVLAALELVRSRPWLAEEQTGTASELEGSWIHASARGVALIGQMLKGSGLNAQQRDRSSRSSGRDRCRGSPLPPRRPGRW